LQHRGDTIKGKSCLVSGSGNVAQFAAQKIMQLGGKVLTLSDSSGFIHDPEGLNDEKLNYLIDLKTVRRGRISEYAEKYKCHFHEGKRPWAIKADLAFPCATQNELELQDAKDLIKGGIIAITEGANMPTTHEAITAIKKANLVFAPGKAANAGGVAVSGLEMTQNSIRLAWSREELEDRLKNIMREIHQQCVNYGTEDKQVDYIKGANIAGFVKVANAMVAYGAV
jgi:glutamate dehydrogenase (NADP+)